MPITLLELPPELLIQILTSLPIKSLLKFSQTSHHARNLAYSNLHTLSLAIFAFRRSSWYNKIMLESKSSSCPGPDPHKILIRIPEARDLGYPTLLTFHNKIIVDILTRHACTLRTLDLTLWTLSTPIAKELANLPTLHNLSIRIESLQPIARGHMHNQRLQERAAWTQLCEPSPSPWPSHLQTLSIENAELTTPQLSNLLRQTPRLHTLTLTRCNALTSLPFPTLSSPLKTSLHSLALRDCSNISLASSSLAAISNMSLQVSRPDAGMCYTRQAARVDVLQVLDLRGCAGLDGEVLERWNSDVWHIGTLVVPRRGKGEDMIIEVDPAYLDPGYLGD